MITTTTPLAIRDLNAGGRLPRGAGSYWREVNYRDLVNEVLAVAGDLYYQASDLTIATSSDQGEMVASVVLTHPDLVTEVGDLSVAISTSNNRRRATTFHHGVIVGDVGVPLGLYPLRARHTARVVVQRDVFQIVRDLMKRLPGIVKYYKNNVLTMRHRSLPEGQVQQLLMDAGRSRIMPWSRIGVIDRLVGAGAVSAWALLLAFAKVAKTNPPLRQLWQIHQFRDSITQTWRAPRCRT
jgi:hypothetical protein